MRRIHGFNFFFTLPSPVSGSWPPNWISMRDQNIFSYERWWDPQLNVFAIWEKTRHDHLSPESTQPAVFSSLFSHTDAMVQYNFVSSFYCSTFFPLSALLSISSLRKSESIRSKTNYPTTAITIKHTWLVQWIFTNRSYLQPPTGNGRSLERKKNEFRNGVMPRRLSILHFDLCLGSICLIYKMKEISILHSSGGGSYLA